MNQQHGISGTEHSLPFANGASATEAFLLFMCTFVIAPEPLHLLLLLSAVLFPHITI